MAPDDALEALALRAADDVDRVAGLEDVDRDAVANVRLAVVRELDESAARIRAGLLEVSTHGRRQRTIRHLLDQAYLNGVKIDYVSTMQSQGFAFENPNASGGCGCGTSFSV